MGKRIAVSILLAAALVGCGGDDDDASDATEAATIPEPSGVGGELADCEFFDGHPTLEVADYFDQGGACGQDRGLTERQNLIPGLGDEQCLDGSALYWNDVGWGSSTGTWTATEDGLPPDDVRAVCRGE